MRPWERNAANLGASLSFYGETKSLGGVMTITAPVAFSVFNIALLTDPVSEMEGELERRVDLARRHFESVHRPWSFWICENWLGPESQRRMARLFRGLGMQMLVESPGMEAPEFPPAKRAFAPMEYRLVDSAEGRLEFTRIVEACFHIPKEVAEGVYHGARWRETGLKIWLGYHEERAVCSAAVIEAAGALGIYSVATLPAFRRLGMAEAVMRHAVSEMRQQGVTGPLVLQSSPLGLSLYKRLGFERTTRFFVFASA